MRISPPLDFYLYTSPLAGYAKTATNIDTNEDVVIIPQYTPYTFTPLPNSKDEYRITGIDPTQKIGVGSFYQGSNYSLYVVTEIERRNHAGEFKNKELATNSYYTAIVKKLK